ncbi:MAG: J domain-containing protein [Acidimicrobiia bacterium]|nr:J domain-containing protein [Acidimicrobiia bacterium]
MALAELEVYQSRPIAPTRRVALGRRDLPVDPAPGFGGILLGGVAAAFVERIDADLHPDLVRLTHQIEQGFRIPQPRLRHRFQTDHIGLNRRTHRLEAAGEGLGLHLDDPPGTAAAPQVLAAIYAAGQLPLESRGPVMELVRKGLRWRGAVEDGLIDYLTGRGSQGGWISAGATDPVTWAHAVLGLPEGTAMRAAVQQAFRSALRDAHPDHGADTETAAQRIAELTEARRILLAR